MFRKVLIERNTTQEGLISDPGTKTNVVMILEHSIFPTHPGSWELLMIQKIVSPVHYMNITPSSNQILAHVINFHKVGTWRIKTTQSLECSNINRWTNYISRYLSTAQARISIIQPYWYHHTTSQQKHNLKCNVVSSRSPLTNRRPLVWRPFYICRHDLIKTMFMFQLLGKKKKLYRFDFFAFF